MAGDSIDVRLGASDDGLQAGLEGAAAQTQESTNAIAEAFTAMRERVASAMVGMGTAVAEGLKETKAQVAETKESLEGFAEGIAGIQKMMGLIGEVAVFGFIGEKVTDLVKEFAEWGDSMEKARAETGMTVEAIQRLQFAAQHSGVSAEEMNGAMMHLSRTMAQAQEGNKQAENAFKSLGISMEEVKSGNVQEVFEKIADAFQHHADGANKAALSMQVFGRSSADMIAFLDKGSSSIDELGERAERLGVIMGEEDVEAASKLDEKLKDQDAVFTVLKRRLGEELAPAFSDLAVAMTNASAKGGVVDGIFTAISAVMKTLAAFVTAVSAAFSSFGVLVVGSVTAVAYSLQGLTLTMVGEFDAAKTAFSTAAAVVKTSTQSIIDDVGGAYKSIWDLISAEEKLGNTEVMPNIGKHQGVGGEGDKKPDFPVYKTGGGDGNHLGDAQRALEEAQNNASLSLTKEKLDEEKALYADQYANGLLNAQQYYAKLLEIQRAGLEAERANKESDLKAAQKDTGTARKSGDRAKVTEDLAKEATLKGEIAVLDQKLANLGPENARQEADAVRKLNEELALTDISKQQNVGKSLAEAAKNEAESRYATGQISKQQLTALEQQLQNDLYQIDMAALQQKLALYNQDTSHNPQKIAEVNAQIEELEAQHQAQMAQLAAQAAQEQMADTKQATDDIEQGFEKAFASFADRTETARQAFVKFITSIESDLTQLVTKDLFNKLFQTSFGSGGGSINSTLTGMFSKLFGGGLGGAAQSTAQTANTTALTTLTATITELIASMQSQIGGGLNNILGGLGSSGDFAGDFGFTATGVTGSVDAVAGGAADSGVGGMSALMGLASFDVGSPYIPTDMVAQIHKGEAIIPAHLNSPFNPNNVAVTQNFHVPGGADMRTQSQIFAMAGMGIQSALRRNG